MAIEVVVFAGHGTVIKKNYLSDTRIGVQMNIFLGFPPHGRWRAVPQCIGMERERIPVRCQLIGRASQKTQRHP